MMEINPGDQIRLKKKHPCGNDIWIIVRSGADIRIQCSGCRRLLLIERTALEKMIREVVSRGAGTDNLRQSKAAP